jgi:RNA polymerase sigma factor (sigma-70 family)
MDSPSSPPYDARQLNDAALWNAFRSGNEAAFARLYHDHLRLLYAYGRRLTPDQSLVEDAIHDVFLELWERRFFLGATDSIPFYLFKALKRRLVRSLTQARLREVPLTPTEFPWFGVVASPEAERLDQEAHTERALRLRQALSHLTPHQREVLFLRFQAGLSYENIADLLQINYQSVVNLVFRAMRTLRRELATLLASLVVGQAELLFAAAQAL